MYANLWVQNPAWKQVFGWTEFTWGTPYDDVLAPLYHNLDQVMFGGAGDDTLIGGDFFNQLDGGSGNNTIIGIGLHNVAYAEFGDDVYYMGGQYWNSIYDFGGDNEAHLLNGGIHNLTLGGGRDTVDARYASGSVYASTGDGDDTFLGGTGYNSANGGPGNDVLVGGPNADYLRGGDGHDILMGLGGPDFLEGGRGRDNLVVGVGDTAFGDVAFPAWWEADGEADIFTIRAADGRQGTINLPDFNWQEGDRLNTSDLGPVETIFSADGTYAFVYGGESGTAITVNGAGTNTVPGYEQSLLPATIEHALFH